MPGHTALLLLVLGCGPRVAPAPAPTPAPQSPAPQLLSVGYMHRCMLDDAGRPGCEGSDALGQASPPDAVLTTISAGLYHSCGLYPDGAPVCWGSDHGPYPGNATANLPPPPPGLLLAAIAAGDAFTCGLRPDGGPVCWGNKTLTPPEGRYVEVVAGYEHARFRDAQGATSCFGADEEASGEGDTGDAAHTIACAVMEDVPDGLCAPEERIPKGWTAPPSGLIARQLAAGAAHTCALTAEGGVRCWGADGWGDGNTIWAGQTRVPADLPPAVEVSAGGGHSCARLTDDTVRCWGDTQSPQGRFVEISSGASQACGRRVEGEIMCW
jgi:hypothetical protein